MVFRRFQGNASGGDLLAGLLLGALLGFFQVLWTGSVLTRLPPPSQLRYLAFTWYIYALLGIAAVWLCGLLPRSGRAWGWLPAAAPALGAGLEIAARHGGAAPLERYGTAVAVGLALFLATSWLASRLKPLRSPASWAAANLAGFLVLAAGFALGPARSHRIDLVSALILAPAILLPLAVLLRVPQRRAVWRPAGATTACLILLAAAGPRSLPAAEGAQRTNVLLITLDTLRADHIGSYGNRKVRTPVIDALAREGVLVENAISPTPMTYPSHTTVLTGFHPARHGVTLNRPLPLKKGMRTLPEILEERGYRTAAFVSGFVLKNRVCRLPERFQLYESDFSRVPLFPEVLLENSLALLALRGMGKDASLGWYERTGGYTVDSASDWLRKHGQDPFFLWVHLYDPHGPYLPPDAFARMYGAGDRGRAKGDWYNVPLEKRREFLKDQREMETLRSLYAAEVTYSDHEVGRLLATLRGLGLLEQTLVVLTSDHGESLTEHGYYFDHSVTLYDPSLRVPLIFRLPGKEHAGLRITRQSSLVDVTPTVLDLLGLPVPRRADGVPLLRTPAGQPAPPALAAVFEGEIQGAKTLLSLRTPDHKYIRTSPWWADHRLIPGEEELYDLVRDPGETVNLASREAALTARYRALAEPYWRSWIEPPAGAGGDLSREDQETLRALGYLQ